MSAQNGPRIAVIGGGTGLAVLLRGLKKRFDHLTAVVTVADDGGNSGALREDLGMLPPGDVRSCLLALADEENAMREILKYRFKDGRLAGQSMGNLMIAALNDIYGSFEDAVSRMSDILRVKGRVIPVTDAAVRLCAELENGNLVFGESQIPRVVLSEGSPIKRVFLWPSDSDAAEAARKALSDADAVLIGPGSLFTSIIPNFLSRGLREALSAARGGKIYVCNVMTQPGETDGFGVADHVERLAEYTGAGLIDCVIANNRSPDAVALAPYLSDGARQILPTERDAEYLRRRGIRLIEDDFIEIRNGYIRHDSTRIADVLTALATRGRGGGCHSLRR
ncbi:MAG: YvcK family protein [Clostridiales Family XIII bacterium]|nr:YvcK family protein [Clostridiales Family XIII bacterium]